MIPHSSETEGIMKNKLLLISAIICLSGLTTAGANLALSDITSPKGPSYRVGISEIPEVQLS